MLCLRAQHADGVRAKIPVDLAAYGVVAAEVTNFNRCEHFPAVSPDEIEAGFYQDLEKLQGYRNTYHTGGLLDFDTVENVMKYSKPSFPTRVCKRRQEFVREEGGSLYVGLSTPQRAPIPFISQTQSHFQCFVLQRPD